MKMINGGRNAPVAIFSPYPRQRIISPFHRMNGRQC